MQFRNILTLVLMLTLAPFVYGQDQVKLDSLLLKSKSAATDTVRIKALLEISNLYRDHNYLKAAEFAENAGELAKKKGLIMFECRADRALANIFMGIGDYKKSATQYFNALKFYEAAADTLGILSMNNNLGTVYDRLHDFDGALKYYLKAQDLADRMKDENQKIRILPSLYNNIANIYQSKGEHQSGLQYYQKALKLAEQSDNKYLQGTALNNLGKLYLNDLKEYDHALEFLSRGLKVRKEVGDKGEISKSHINLANYFLDTGDLEEANTQVTLAIDMGREVGSLDVQKNGYSIRSEIETKKGRYRESLDAYRVFKQLSDSIQSQQANSEITRLQLQYDFEKADQAREQERKQVQIRYVSIIVLLGVCLMVAIFVSILVRSKARQTELKRKNLAQDVEIKNKELTTNVIYLIRKNELINNVAERLLKMQHNLLPENHRIIHEIIIDLQHEADSDIWKEFELRFNQVHSEFYKNIRKLYPNLSPADEKLCAFLRLNMSSKEIAAITQQSIKSVEVARARLRKKLNLTNTTSNLVTHLSNV